MTFIPTVECLSHFRPALPRSVSARVVTPKLAARFPDLPTRLTDLIEANLLEAAELYLQQTGQELTEENIERERREMARLRIKYSSD
jgi:hypothetical protein